MTAASRLRQRFLAGGAGVVSRAAVKLLVGGFEFGHAALQVGHFDAVAGAVLGGSAGSCGASCSGGNLRNASSVADRAVSSQQLRWLGGAGMCCGFG